MDTRNSHPQVRNRTYFIEILPPKIDSDKLLDDLDLFSQKYNRVLKSGFCACLTDNAMGKLSYQPIEVIQELELNSKPDQVMIHLTTFHTLTQIHEILDFCLDRNIFNLLVVTGDGSPRLPKLSLTDMGAVGSGKKNVTSVELVKYIHLKYPSKFNLGVAFNPYEPFAGEFAKMEAKVAAGASFIVTQPILAKNENLDVLLAKYADMPVILDAWMSKNIHLLSEAVGHLLSEDGAYDPVANLEAIHKWYPQCKICLTQLNFKAQFHLLDPDMTSFEW
jgi:methylenetetrahydrofolate reductase (NADPH)